MITVLRIVFAIQFNADDYTYDYNEIGITTGLEPVLGIIIRMLRSKTDQDSQHVLSSSTIWLRSKSIKRSSMFRKIDDSYPIMDLEEGRSENEITGPDSKASSLAIC